MSNNFTVAASAELMRFKLPPQLFVVIYLPINLKEREKDRQLPQLSIRNPNNREVTILTCQRTFFKQKQMIS